jgi:hypothetical protein
VAGGDERGQHDGQRGQSELRDHQQATLGQPVGEGPGDDREEQDRPELQRADEAQQQRRVGELQHQPRLGDRVHPSGHHRSQLGHEEAPEVGVVERP